MTGDESELARLRRRAYGPAADIADDPAALARLRELEGASGGAPSFATPVVAGPAEDPPAADEPEARPRDPSPVEEPAAPAARRAPRWITRGVAIGSAAVLVAVLLVAGAFGWGGGFLAGWAQGARSADLPPEAELMTVLEPTEMPAGLEEQLGDWLVNQQVFGEDGAVAETVYFGSVGDSLHLMRRADGLDPVVFEDQVCVQVVYFIDDGDAGPTTAFSAMCGSRRAGLTLDLFASDPENERAFMGVPIDDLDPGTLIRLVYDDPAQTISVWTLPPAAEEPDPAP